MKNNVYMVQMIKINVLLENSTVNAQYKPKHGLSVLIEHEGKKILLDTGPDNNFAKNAAKMKADLKNADYLFLSHNHYDHTGGINKFLEINSTAPVYLMDNVSNKYYIKVLFFYKYVGIKLRRNNLSRITSVSNDLSINNKIYFLSNTVSEYKKPILNKNLFKKENNKIVNDTFDHEGILVLDDNNELVIFNSCSHNGILNTIETVKSKIPGRKIKAYVGGLHLFNPPKTRKNEYRKYTDYLDYLTEKLKGLDIVVYTGHCTGKFASNYMKEKLGNLIQKINTGMELTV